MDAPHQARRLRWISAETCKATEIFPLMPSIAAIAICTLATSSSADLAKFGGVSLANSFQFSSANGE
jgi:hypothetical protein